MALDLSGRPFVVYDVPFGEVLPLGDPPFNPEMAEHFWQSFATAAGITLHVTKRAGRNTHHVVEATFKGVARCLRDAVRVEGTGVPVHQGHAVTRRPCRSSRSSTTASATCARPRRRSQQVGADARLTADPASIADAAGVVLPGVGAFGRCMEALRDAGPRPSRPSRRSASGRPFLGICVGMQMLYEGSEETPGVDGPRRAARAASGCCPTA